jgi:hypothetical protein
MHTQQQTLPGLAPATGAPQNHDLAREAARDKLLLANCRYWTSAAALAARLKQAAPLALWDEPEVRRRLAALQERGRVQRRPWGAGYRWRANPGVAR